MLDAPTVESTKPQVPGFREELAAAWQSLPCKPVFFLLLAAWVGLFHWLGNSTLGYVDTQSLFSWWAWVHSQEDGAHAWLIPVVVLALFWWKRADWLPLPKTIWWPALSLLVIALLLHIAGYVIQQTRLSVIAFFLGLYGFTGMVWGLPWLRATFFPFFLFGFCVPLGNSAEFISFPLRLLATKITVGLSQGLLSINVIQNGTSIFEPTGKFQYEVAAACSGIRSLTAIFALSTIYAFIVFRSNWKRLVLIASAFPLAVVSNVIRLVTIIIAAEAFGQSAGAAVHNSEWFSLVPYLPGIVGILFLARWLGEEPMKRP